MHKKQLSQLLTRLKQNSQHLTHLTHITQPSFPPTAHYSLKDINQVCPISIAKIVVQLSYLYYACAVGKLELLVAGGLGYVRKGVGYQGRGVYYLGLQSVQVHQNNNKKHLLNTLKFLSLPPHTYNTTLLQYLHTLLQTHTSILSQRTPEQTLTKQTLLTFHKHIKKYLQPSVQKNPQLPVIKLLERTRLFGKFSYLFAVWRSSLFYRVRRDQGVLEEIRGFRLGFLGRAVHLAAESKSQYYVYKEIDNFLLALITRHVFHMQKSSTKDQGSNDSYTVGSITKQLQNQKYTQIYQARFYTYFSNLSDPKTADQPFLTSSSSSPSRQPQKNIYLLSYSFETLTMHLKYITLLQCNLQYMDAISSHCANIQSSNYRLSIQPIEFLQSNVNGISVKKFVAFKVSGKLERVEEPFSRVLVMVEFVAVCGRVFLELMAKKAEKDQSGAIKEYSARLEHLLRMFVDKANHFYQSL